MDGFRKLHLTFLNYLSVPAPETCGGDKRLYVPLVCEIISTTGFIYGRLKLLFKSDHRTETNNVHHLW